ncbi:MAG: hypothetical protein WC538_06820 [Thermoanaerobaculia bacterium]|jgi:hypothetical protein
MASATMTDNDQQLAFVFQYTVEAYKQFQKFAEILHNPMSAATFKRFAEDERQSRDLLEIRYLGGGAVRVPLTLGSDLKFQDVFEGDLSDREQLEMLLVRERTMEKKLAELAQNGPAGERNLYHYLGATKRAHVAYLERELELARLYKNWLSREDGEDVVVHGVE